MSGIGEHLYREMLSAMSQNPIRDSITRQEPIVRQWIETSIEKGGVDLTSDLIEDMISANEIYSGSRPVFNQMVDFLIEMDANNIERDTAKFFGQVSRAGDFGSLDTFYQKDNEIIPVDSPNREPSRILQAEDEMKTPEHPLRQSWDAVVARYQDAELSNDEFAMASAERTLDRLRQQIQAAPLAKATPEPVKAPATPAQAPKSDIDRMDELDKRIDALPDSGVYSTEQQAELDSIDAELDDLDTADGIYFADEDYG